MVAPLPCMLCAWIVCGCRLRECRTSFWYLHYLTVLFFFSFFFSVLLSPSLFVVVGFQLGVVEYGATIEAFEKAGKPERGLEMLDEMVSKL